MTDETTTPGESADGASEQYCPLSNERCERGCIRICRNYANGKLSPVPSPSAPKGETGSADNLDSLLDAYRDALLSSVETDNPNARKLPPRSPQRARESIAVALQQLRAEREGGADLKRFYSVETTADLIAAMARHIEKLQAKLPPTRDEQHRTPREG